MYSRENISENREELIDGLPWDFLLDLKGQPRNLMVEQGILFILHFFQRDR